MKLLIIDIETTGLSCSSDRITAIGTIVYDSVAGQTLTERCFNIEKAEKNKCVAYIAEMKVDLTALLDECDRLIAFNGINFDFPFIDKWLGVDAAETGQNNTGTGLGEKRRMLVHTMCAEPNKKKTLVRTNSMIVAGWQKDSLHTLHTVDTLETLDNTLLVHQTEACVSQSAFSRQDHVAIIHAPPQDTLWGSLSTPSGPPEGQPLRVPAGGGLLWAEGGAPCGGGGAQGARDSIATTGHKTWPAKYVDFCLMSLEYTNMYISLKNLCSMNCVQAEKSGTGLDAIVFAQNEQWDELEFYCQQDVRVLLELTQRALSHGLKYPCKGYTSKNEEVHIVFDAQMLSLIKPTDSLASANGSIFQAIAKKYLQECPKQADAKYTRQHHS